MMRTTERPVRYLRVISRVAGDRHHPWLELSVDCPRRGRVGFHECADCSLCTRLVYASRRKPMLVECRYQAISEARKTPELGAIEHTPISALLDRGCTCLAPDLGIEEVTTLFLAHELSHAPVVDERGRLVGLLTMTDIVRWRWRKPAGAHGSVRAVMGPVPFTLPEDTNVGCAAALLARDRLDVLVVLSRRGRVAGLLSSRELLAWLASAAST